MSSNVEFPESLTAAAFRATNDELAWTRTQAMQAIPILARSNVAILGGELWWVLGAGGEWTGLVPQELGLDSMYHWETDRLPDEPWSEFVQRCASESLAAVNELPPPGELRSNLRGRILYNLTWVSDDEYDRLVTRSFAEWSAGPERPDDSGA